MLSPYTIVNISRLSTRNPINYVHILCPSWHGDAWIVREMSHGEHNITINNILMWHIPWTPYNTYFKDDYCTRLCLSNTSLLFFQKEHFVPIWHSTCKAHFAFRHEKTSIFVLYRRNLYSHRDYGLQCDTAWKRLIYKSKVTSQFITLYQILYRTCKQQRCTNCGNCRYNDVNRAEDSFVQQIFTTFIKVLPKCVTHHEVIFVYN